LTQADVVSNWKLRVSIIYTSSHLLREVIGYLDGCGNEEIARFGTFISSMGTEFLCPPGSGYYDL